MIASRPDDWRDRSLVRRVHAWNARVLGVFLVAHLVNHLFLTAGPDVHWSVMEPLRVIYRNGMVEPLLIGLFIVQIVAGLWLARRNWRPDSGWARAQVISGLVIAFFLVQHIAATLYVRNAYETIDTNAWWALSVVTPVLLATYFVPYYFAAVTALGVHIASALHFRGIGAARPIAFASPVLAAVIVGSMLFHAQTNTLPPAYQDYLSGMFGL